MADESPQVAAVDANARYEVPEEKRSSARRWFEQARKLVDQRNYDYAIKSFVEGLQLYPDAVEEGWQPLRGCAVARWQTGGKKAGRLDTVKFSMTTKDPIKGLTNAAWLFGLDPTNASYAEGIFRNAAKAHCDDTAMWAGPIYRDLLGAEKKPNPKKFCQLKEAYEQIGDRFQARREMAPAVRAYELAVEALDHQKSLDPKNRELNNLIRDLSTKLTILRGNYQSAESFKESISDSDEQARIHDEDRLVQGADRLGELVEKARVEMEANPTVEGKVIHYVEMLCKDENDEHEKEAISLLVERFKSTNNYRFKLRADEIAMRQVRRHVRLARTAGNAERLKDLVRRQVAFELSVFKERVAKYPTDLRLKYEYGTRLFRARRFDDAIPLLQQGRGEPKVRHLCALYLGRCFFEKGFHSQAVSILREAISQYDLTEDETAKDLNYWLGRALAEDGKVDEARGVFSGLMQIEYNYRDVRDRIEQLR
jgi:tetratricopeptide (TPR) repeat protein